MDDKQHLSKARYKELKDELDFLKSTKRREIAEQLEYAKSLGDLSENAEYQQAREEQGKLEERIGRLELIVKNAVIVAPQGGTTINIGSTVVVRKGAGGDPTTYIMVGSEEADMAAGKLSDLSPIGKALMGHTSSESVKVQTPGGPVEYHIDSVS